MLAAHRARPASVLAAVVTTVVTTAVAVGGLAVLTVSAAAPASAADPGPTAIAVGPDGTTWVGTAAGGSLQRVDVTGALLAPVPLPRAGSVDGLYVEQDTVRVWVSYGGGASLIDASGTELGWIDASGSATCPTTGARDPGTYGGVVATADRIVLTHRCGDGIGLNTYARSDLTARGGASAYGCPTCRFGQIAFSPRATTQTPQGAYYVTVPDAAEVQVWSGFDNVHGTPVRTIDVQAHGGGVTPRPTGVAVDDEGTTFVTDSANHVVYVYDADGTYSRYIGNPPDPDTGSDFGFDTPVAISQYPRTGSISQLRGNLLIADRGSNRVVRRDTYTWLFWNAPLDGSSPPPSGPPVNTTKPSISGTPAVGQTLTCDPGAWAGSPTSFLHGWNRDFSYVPGENATTYVVRPGDAGRKIECFVQGVNDQGTSDYAVSAPVTISATPPPPSAPVNTIRPTIAGTPQVGETLTCGDGQWSGSPAPTYSRQWQRSGTALPGATSSAYVVTGDDVGLPLTCRVTATNSAGSATASSVAVTPTDGPVTTPCSGRPGVSIDAGAVWTTSAAVTLTVRPPAGATQVVLSNDGGFDDADVRPVAADCRYPWTLRVGGGTATKHVYARFVGGGVDEVATLSDDVVLDAAAPALRRPVARPVARKQSARPVYRVRLAARDAVSGVQKARFAAHRGGQGRVLRAKAAYRTRTPGAFRWVQVTDRAGSTSAWKRARIKR
ncbi:MAG: hypothetical protein CMH83_04970 [Nocardioides sp.]|nr:hypothetical protein [Nocardioides sp.]